MKETVIGYVYDSNGYHGDAVFFEGTIENIASFIMTNRWNETVVTDLMDNLLAKSFIGGFLNKADSGIIDELRRELVPMQNGEKEPVRIEYLNDDELVYEEGWII